MFAKIMDLDNEEIKDYLISILPWLIILLMAFNMYYQQVQFSEFKSSIIARTQFETTKEFKNEINILSEEISGLREEIKNYKEDNEKEMAAVVNNGDEEKRLLENYQYIMSRENGLSKQNILTLEKYAKTKDMPDINPHLVFAMQYVESRFNPNSENGGVYGLGQISLSTAKYIKDYFGYNDIINENTLKDPNLNIKYHVSYLKLLYKTKGRNWYNVIMVYSGAKMADDPNAFMWKYIGKMNDFLSKTRGTSFQKIIADKDFKIKLE